MSQKNHIMLNNEDHRSSGFLIKERIGDGEATTGHNVVNEKRSEIENPNSERENSSLMNESETSKIVVEEGKREVDVPPADDCCPICFGDFSIAVKTNCGHWFCATCILQFWNYRAALQKCKCPICSRLISKLTPEASLLILQEQEVIQVLKNVQRYNHLFQGGAHGFLRKVIELPLAFRRMFEGLFDPDNLRYNYYTMRVVALLLSCMYNMSPFNFIPTVGLFRRVLQRRRVRILADAHF